MFDDDDKNEEFLNEPIDGQMSIFEFMFNNLSEEQEEVFNNAPTEGQYSLFDDDYLKSVGADLDNCSQHAEIENQEKYANNDTNTTDDTTIYKTSTIYSELENNNNEEDFLNLINFGANGEEVDDTEAKEGYISNAEENEDYLNDDESVADDECKECAQLDDEVDYDFGDGAEECYADEVCDGGYGENVKPCNVDEEGAQLDVEAVGYGTDYADGDRGATDLENYDNGGGLIGENINENENLLDGEFEGNSTEKNIVKCNVFTETDSSNSLSIKIDNSKERKGGKMNYEKTDVKGKKRNDGGHNDYRIQSIDEVLHNSMIPYSEFVLLDRALPRVEDGLKPVQRRILYTMIEQGLTPDKPYRKCAKVVGDCLGKYHPHGDTSVYDAMVRMAQPYNMRGVLVQGHGNFGSIDGDSAAAMRYTEAKLAPLALELLRDIDKDTVNWSFNFDDSLKEPDTLPGRFPNLLVNGAMGIAVGLATNIPPHNLNEVIDGVVALIDRPNITLKDMLKIIKGPDFPTGGIVSTDELYQAYETGRGKITVRAKTSFEDAGAGKTNIVISEIPYQKNKASLLAKIADIREDKKGVLLGIQDIKDESDRKGMRAVITVKAGYNPNDILNLLFKYSDLQSSFGINMVAIADGKPKQLSLMQILKYYLNYQVEIIVRRTKFDLNNAKERLHILEGLHIAIVNIDEVVQIIKTSKSTTEAKVRLRERFLLSEKQAQAILDMRLARLTSLEVYKIEQEMKELKALIEKLTAILNSKKLQLETIKTEMLEIKRHHSMPRATKIVKAFDEIDVDSILEANKVVEETYVALTRSGTIKRMQPKHFETTVKEFGVGLTENELNFNIIKTTTDKSLVAFTTKGNVVKIAVEALKEVKWRDKGTALRAICKELDVDEKFVSMFEMDEKSTDELLFVTKLGMAKRTLLSKYAISKQVYVAIKLKEGDAVVNVCKVNKNETLMMVTKHGMALNCDVGEIAVLERVSQGAKAMSLNKDDAICYASSIPITGELVLATQKGFGKRINMGNIELARKGNKGTKVFPLLDNDAIIFADVSKTDAIYAVKFSGNDEFNKKELKEFFPDSKKGKGKSLSINKNGDKISAVYKFIS